MKGSTVALLALGAAGAAGAVYWFVIRPRQAAPGMGAIGGVSGVSAMAPPPHPQSSTATRAIQTTVATATGVPIAALGAAASKAPTWAKLAVLPIGATAVAQKVLTHPVDSIKAGVAIPVNIGKSILGGITSLF